jgi:hypothetical protein
MLTYFGAVVKLPMQDRFDAGSLRDSAALDSTALAVPQVLCCTRRPKAAQARHDLLKKRRRPYPVCGVGAKPIAAECGALE